MPTPRSVASLCPADKGGCAGWAVVPRCCASLLGATSKGSSGPRQRGSRKHAGRCPSVFSPHSIGVLQFRSVSVNIVPVPRVVPVSSAYEFLYCASVVNRQPDSCGVLVQWSIHAAAAAVSFRSVLQYSRIFVADTLTAAVEFFSVQCTCWRFPNSRRTSCILLSAGSPHKPLPQGRLFGKLWWPACQLRIFTHLVINVTFCDGRLITVEMLSVYYFVVLVSTRQTMVSHSLLRVFAVSPSRFVYDRAIACSVCFVFCQNIQWCAVDHFGAKARLLLCGIHPSKLKVVKALRFRLNLTEKILVTTICLHGTVPTKLDACIGVSTFKLLGQVRENRPHDKYKDESGIWYGVARFSMVNKDWKSNFLEAHSSSSSAGFSTSTFRHWYSVECLRRCDSQRVQTVGCLSWTCLVSARLWCHDRLFRIVFTSEETSCWT